MIYPRERQSPSKCNAMRAAPPPPARPLAGPAAAVAVTPSPAGFARPENAPENASAAASAARSIGRGRGFRSVFSPRRAALRPLIGWWKPTPTTESRHQPKSVGPTEPTSTNPRKGGRPIARSLARRNRGIPQFQFPDNSHSSRDAARETRPPNLRAPRAERTAKGDPPPRPRAPTRFEPVTIPFFVFDFTYFA